MKPIVFRCPTTGQLVQHFIAEHPNADDVYRFETVRCAACRLTHMINRATGEAVRQRD